MHDDIKLSLNGQIVSIEEVVSKTVYKELQDRIIIPPFAEQKFKACFAKETLEWPVPSTNYACNKGLFVQSCRYFICSLFLLW